LEANRLDRFLCVSASTFTAKCPLEQKVVRLAAPLAMHTRTRGGSSDTEVNEFAVKPRGVPDASRVVTIVTPVTNAPSAARNALTSTASPPLSTDFMRAFGMELPSGAALRSRRWSPRRWG